MDLCLRADWAAAVAHIRLSPGKALQIENRVEEKKKQQPIETKLSNSQQLKNAARAVR